VILRLVEQMQCAKKEVEPALVHAFLNIMEIPTLDVVQNVLLILNVIILKLVSIRNARTHVLERVETTHNVLLLIIVQHVNVLMDILEILQQDVGKYLEVIFFFNYGERCSFAFLFFLKMIIFRPLIPAILHLVVLKGLVRRWTDMRFVHV
jgi:hypothetical protein